MSRSQLLKDLVTNTGDLESILLRLKIILTDLKNEEIMNWVVGELEGYAYENVPEYRVIRGSPVGTFDLNLHTRHTNAVVPLENLIPKEVVKDIVHIRVKESAASIQNMLKNENQNNYAKTIPTSYCYSISTEEIQLLGMKVIASSNKLYGVMSIVKSKLVDIIMELEKQFENLDDLDIRAQVEEDEAKREIVIYNLGNIIYEGAIEVGDGNKIKNSRLGNLFGGKK